MISIIIPTYNEAGSIGKLLLYLHKYAVPGTIQIIVTDGGSTDETIAISKKCGATAVLSPQKGRAAQMNFGVAFAKEDILYFIHADTIPPTSYWNDITIAVKKGYEFGRYRTKFDSGHFLLKLNAFFTRFDLFTCYGGDQTLFITKELFKSIGGFSDGMQIMEDYEIVVRAKKQGRYKIIQKNALISTRKYDTNSWYRVQKANYTIVQMYKRGASQQELVEKYQQLLTYR
ncbi:MAG: TIGR04283 family arsenosugar biosynthesis glycosyltransferase [Bacteroidota bacterium]